MLGAAYPWVARRLLTDTSPELRSTLMALLYKDGVFQFKRMESLISQAVRPTGRPQPRRSPQAGQSEWRRRCCLCWAVRLLRQCFVGIKSCRRTALSDLLPNSLFFASVSALAAAAGAVQRGDALALLLSPEGEFVRGIGAGQAWRLLLSTATAQQTNLDCKVAAAAHSCLPDAVAGACWHFDPGAHPCTCLPLLPCLCVGLLQ